MLKQYDYLIEGIHCSGRKFSQHFIVIAANEAEAREELQVCLDYYEPVRQWSITMLESVEEQDNPTTAEMYAQSGAFTVYDPLFNFVD